MVTVRGAEGKQQLPQVSCHLTRGFCAQLLANGQAAAADKNKKCIGAVNVDLLLQMEVPRKPPAQKRATVKPIKPEAVIVISPDTKEEVKEKNSLRRKAAAEDSSRKTYTATLTARSKAACGIAATILSIIMYGSPLSIIRLVIKTKSVEFMPFLLSVFVFLCGTSWFIFGLLGKDPFVAIPNGFGCGLGAVQLILYAIYCDNKSFPDGSGKMVGVDGKPSGEDIQLGIRMGQNQSKEDLV